MMKVAVNGAITLWFGLHFRHQFHGPPVDYVGLARGVGGELDRRSRTR